MATGLIIGRSSPEPQGDRSSGLGFGFERDSNRDYRNLDPAPTSSRSVVLRLILLDELLHADGIGLPVAVAFDGAGPAGRLDVDVGEHQVRVDAHRRDVRHVHRVFEAAEPLGRVMDDAGRRNRHLCRKQSIARAHAARAKHVSLRERPPFPPDDEQKKHDRCRDRDCSPEQARIGREFVHGM